MSHLPLPLVPAYSQFDGGPLASQNCTITSVARLLRYEFGIITTGSTLRRCQTDQIGGTSIPDGARAAWTCHRKSFLWAAPNDGTAPQGRTGDYITRDRLRQLLDSHYMVLVQGDFDQITGIYRVGSDFMGDHAFTVDGRRSKRLTDGRLEEQVYVVDTQPKVTSGYRGQWMPMKMLLAYANKLAGTGRIYAAWARPPQLPPTDTEEPEVKGLEIYDFHVKPGTVKVKNITGVQAIQIADSERFGQPAGSVKPVAGWGRVRGTVLGSVHGTNPMVWVVADLDGGPVEFAVLLYSQVDFTAAEFAVAD